MGKFRAHACAACVLASGAALAQPKSPNIQKAGDLVKQAIAKSQAGDHDAAITLYLNAYSFVPQPMLLSNIGSEYQQANKPEDALKYFCRYLDADPNGTNVTYATAQAKSLQIQLGNQVDDKNVCKAKPKVATPAPPPPPITTPASEPPTGPTPPPSGAVDASTAPNAAHPTPVLEYAGFATVGVGAVLFGVGTYYGVEAKRLSDEITNHDVSKPWDPNIKSIQAEGGSDDNRQIGFMVAGGIVLAGGVALTLVGYTHASGERIAITPIASPTTVGVAVGGGF